MEIDSQINELEAQIIELERKKKELEEIRKRDQNKLTINITKFTDFKVNVKLSKYRSDIVDYLRYNTNRIFSETIGNTFDTTYFPKFLSHIEKDETITIVWDKDALKAYEEWKERPDIFVDLDDNKPYVNLKLGPRMSGSYLSLTSEIPSFVNDIGKGFRFSVAEFYLFPNAISNFVATFKEFKLVYSERALKVLEEQLEKRKLIMELANATDYPMPSPFINGLDLKPDQRVAIKFVEVSGGKCIIAYDMGLGKTAIAIGLAERHPEWKKILVICPANLKTNWRREIERFTGQKAAILSGIEPDNVSIEQLVDCRYCIINYDIIGREVGPEDDKIMKWVEVINVIQPDLIIADEAHYIKNMDSKRSRGVRALKVKNVIPMSGTPLVNRPAELYPPLSMIAPNTFNSPTAFMNQFTNYDGTARNVKKLHDMMMGYMIRRTRKDIYGDKIFIERIPFTKELSPQARALYTKILQGIYISLRKPDYQTNVTSILAELMRCKQTSSADNIQASAELAMDAYEETEKKVIIFSQFKESQYGIEQLLGRQACVVNGDVKDETRYKLMDDFQDPTSGLKFWITNILEGMTLTQAHTVIFNDIWWTPKDHSQAEGRCFGRANDPHGGNSYWIENEHTIDQFLNALIMKKTAIFNEVVDGVRQSQEDQEGIIKQLIQHLKEGI